jgi:hypothetical protein
MESEEMEERTRKVLWVTGVTAAAVTAAGTLAALFVRDQISRQRRNLFSALALKRMAALEHIARQGPSVDHINVLRDYIAWEPRRLLRNRARAIVERMEGAALERGPAEEPAA